MSSCYRIGFKAGILITTRSEVAWVLLDSYHPASGGSSSFQMHDQAATSRHPVPSYSPRTAAFVREVSVAVRQRHV